MARGHNAALRLASQTAPSPFLVPSICRSCLHTLRHASTATAPIEPSPTDRAPPPLTASTSPRLTYKIKASVILSRPPIITRDLTPFEKAYFLYQRRLNERLALPFTRYFYYQKGTPGDIDWKRKIKERQTPARDIGVYNAYGKEGWNDELLVGARESEPEAQIEALLKDADAEVVKREAEGQEQAQEEEVMKEEVEKPMPRITEADRNDNRKSLNRSLQRTLYLVVKRKGEKRWMFPTSDLEMAESLHTAAERLIVQSGGLNMNTWVVGNMPMGHQVINFPQGIVDQENGAEQRGEKVFFMKARIIAGQANLGENQLDLDDFEWLSRDEIQKHFEARDWNAIRTILAER